MKINKIILGLSIIFLIIIFGGSLKVFGQSCTMSYWAGEGIHTSYYWSCTDGQTGIYCGNDNPSMPPPPYGPPSADPPPPPPVNGVCGPANGKTFAFVPILNSTLCSAGTVSPTPSWVGPWSWTCKGKYGGSDSGSCSALKPTPPNISAMCNVITVTTDRTPIYSNVTVLDRGNGLPPVTRRIITGYTPIFGTTTQYLLSWNSLADRYKMFRNNILERTATTSVGLTRIPVAKPVSTADIFSIKSSYSENSAGPIPKTKTGSGTTYTINWNKEVNFGPLTKTTIGTRSLNTITWSLSPNVSRYYIYSNSTLTTLVDVVAFRYNPPSQVSASYLFVGTPAAATALVIVPEPLFKTQVLSGGATVRVFADTVANILKTKVTKTVVSTIETSYSWSPIANIARYDIYNNNTATKSLVSSTTGTSYIFNGTAAAATALTIYAVSIPDVIRYDIYNSTTKTALVSSTTENSFVFNGTASAATALAVYGIFNSDSDFSNSVSFSGSALGNCSTESLCLGSIPTGSTKCPGTIENDSATWSLVTSCTTSGKCQYTSTSSPSDPPTNPPGTPGAPTGGTPGGPVTPGGPNGDIPGEPGTPSDPTGDTPGGAVTCSVAKTAPIYVNNQVSINTNTTWVASTTPPCIGSTCTVSWKIVDANGTTTLPLMTSTTLNRIFTTVGLKKVSADIYLNGASIICSSNIATTSVVQSGTIIEQ